MNDKKGNSNTKTQMKLNQKNLAMLPSSRSAIRKIYPLGYRVVVKIKKDGNQTEGGLYLPEGAKQNMQDSLLVEVLEVATAHDDDFDHATNVSGVPLGALVLIPKEAGVKIPWDETLRIVDTEDVLAVVSEISIT